MKILGSYNILNYKTLTLLATLLMVAGCSSSKQTSATGTNCNGGVVSVSQSQNASTATLHSGQSYSGRFTVTAGQAQIVVSQCPQASDVSRVVTIRLAQEPTSGARVMLTSPSVAGASYLDYSEFDQNSGTIKSWLGSGSLTITEYSDDQVSFTAESLVMNPRPDIGRNGARGAFRFSVQGAALRGN